MKASGAYILPFGLESYSQPVIDSLKKHITSEQIHRIVHLVRENEMGIQGSFIFGDVAETCETAKETLDFLKEHEEVIGTGVSTSFIVPFQGTPIYKQCVREGIIKDEVKFIQDRISNGYNYLEPMNMTSLTDTEFKKLKEKVFGMALTSKVYSIANKEWKDSDENNWIEVECPSCHKISTIKNVPSPIGYSVRNVGCRHCYYRFNLVSKWYPFWRYVTKILGFTLVYKLYGLKNVIGRKLW
jgi:hypothetical protein